MIEFGSFKYMESMGYIPLCEHYPQKKSGFNFGYGGSDLKALGWNFLGFNCLFTGRKHLFRLFLLSLTV